MTCNTGFKTPDCESSFVATCSASGELTGVTTCDPGAGCRRRALQSDADADTAQKTAPAAGATQLPPALRAVCSPYEVTGNRAFVRVGPQAVDGTGPIEAESTVAVTCEAGFAFGCAVQRPSQGKAARARAKAPSTEQQAAIEGWEEAVAAGQWQEPEPVEPLCPGAWWDLIDPGSAAEADPEPPLRWAV